MNYRQDIQVLRGIAVLLVVLFHLQVTFISSGFLGVDVFFVISGFLMAVLYNPKDKKGFFIRRSKRLLPLYFFVIFVTLISAYFIVIPNDFYRVADQSLFALLFSSNIGFWLEDSYFSKINFSPLLHLWSLGVEIQFYLLLPLIAYFIRLHKSVVWLLCIVSFICCLFMTGYNSKHTFFMMPFRLWEFLIGYIIASYYTNNGNLKYKELGWLGLFSLLFVLLLSMLSLDVIDNHAIYGHPGLVALVVCLLTALVLCFGLPSIFLRSFMGKGLETLGRYSYSIYLTHFPIITLYLYSPFEGTSLNAESFRQMLFVMMLIAIGSVFFYRYIEDHFSRKTSSSIKLSVGSVFLIIILVYVGGKFIHLNFPKELRSIFYSTVDRGQFRCGKLFKLMNPAELTCPINNIEYANGTVMLIGNSHADALKNSFAEVATEKKLNARFFVSNRPLIEQRFSIDSVVNHAIKYKVTHLVFHFSEISMKDEDIIERIEELGEKVKAIGIKVSYLMPVPRWRESVPKALYLANLDNSAVQNQNASNVYHEYKDVYSQMRARSNSFVNYYDLVPYFCDKECKMQDTEGNLLYFDSHHLTLSGAILLEGLFREIL